MSNQKNAVTAETLYQLGLHDERNVLPGVDVIRVPGGWVYLFVREEDERYVTEGSVFVPFSNEFKP